VGNTSCNSLFAVRHEKLIVADTSSCNKQLNMALTRLCPVMSAVFSEYRLRRIIKIPLNIIILSRLGIENDVPETLVIIS